jgi:nitrous oxide reductase family maturation protein NosD
MIGLATVALLLQGATHVVGSNESYRRVNDAVSASQPGDTILVRPGIYREHVTLSHPLVVLGTPGAVLEGSGQGQVIIVQSPAEIRGLTIRGSGSDLSREDAGIWADRADGLLVEDNTLEDVLFGVYVKQSSAVTVRGNHIVGKPLPIARRGDGIRLWYSRNGRIDSNVVRNVRDVVIWFSDSVTAHHNEITDSRYGLHYMYSNHNRFEDNRFLRNEVGAFLMYSRDIQFRGNVFAYARGGLGKGLGFKDSEAIDARRNVIVKNAIGIYLDNSPLTQGVTNTFDDNVIAFNDAGVALLPSVSHNTFQGNAFVDNVQPATVTGGGSALTNEWRGNFWSDYAGFDEDGDGRGDLPYRYERLVDEFFAEHDELKVFQLSLSAATLNAIGRLVPLLAPQPMLIDSFPRIARPTLDVPSAEAGQNDPAPAVAAWIGILVVAVATIGVLRLPVRVRS